MSLPTAVRVCEMGPRDGLQNEHTVVSTADKVRYIDMLSESGLPLIETTSFVSPKAIPQLADAAEVFSKIDRRSGVRYPVLAPNVKGLERAKAAGADAIGVFTAASEEFTRRNINMTIDQSIETFRDVVRNAKENDMWVRGYVSTAFGSPFGDRIEPVMVAQVARRLLDLGCDEISIGDTIGVGVPSQVDELVPLLRQEIPISKLAMHFHDTRGTALANVYAALQHGIEIFDSSSGGLGGCPYAPGATGNLGTEDLLYMLHGMQIRTGVDLTKVRAASRFIAGVLDHELTSKAFQAMERAAG